MINKKTTWATPFALVIAVVLIFAAYLVPHWSDYFKASHVEAGTTDDLLKAISTKDSDGDGLPDWEEALYGTDPSKVDTFGYGMTDAQAVAQGRVVPKAATPVATNVGTSTPGTATSSADANIPGTAPAPGSLTEQFAHAFFAQYIAAHKGAPLSASDLTTFVASAIVQLQQSQSQQDAYTLSQVNVQGSGAAAMRTYAAAAEAAFAAHTIQAQKSELLYLGDAISNNDAEALVMIGKIAQAYTDIGTALIKVPVPQELAPQHLALANALAQMGNVTQQLAALKRDPLLTSLGLANYAGDVTAMRNSFVHIAQVFSNAGIVLKAGDPGYSMVSITPANGY